MTFAKAPMEPMVAKTYETFIQTGTGRIPARIWTPDGTAAKEADPILLFHESLGCIELWRGFPERLAAATCRPVIAYDRLGFGRADPHPGRLGTDFIAAEAEECVPLLKNRFGFTRFAACGHSVGGGMAAEAAARFPEDCAALVTLGAQAFVEDRTLEGIRRAAEVFIKPETFSRLQKYHGDKAGWVLDAWIGTWLSPAFSGWTLDPAIARLRCPVLAIHGDADEYGSDRHARRIARHGGRTAILPGVGHFPHREDEDGVLELIRRFLSNPQPETA